MRALCRRDGGLHLDERAAPALLNDDDVRVRVHVAGLCRTDIYVARGQLPVREPLILGHEFAGVVIDAGSSDDIATGDHVTGIPMIPCGVCSGCASNSLCLERRFLGIDLDGAFADEVVLPSRSLRKLPPALEFRHGAYTEPVAAALAVLNRPLPKHGLGLILGNNRIALLTERILLNTGFSNVLRISPDQAHEFYGEADFVVETDASSTAIQAMLQLLRQGGIGVLKSRPAASVPVNLALAVKKDISFFAASYGSFERAIELITDDALGIDNFLGQTYELEEFEAALIASTHATSLKNFLCVT